MILVITRERFLRAVGREPEDDDLERCNCAQAGAFGHMLCGWNHDQNLPRFLQPAPEHERSRDA